MRRGHASLTAAAVAAARALASSTKGALLDPGDRIAERLLPRPLSLAVQALRAGDAGRGWIASAATHASLGMVDHLALRSAAIDQRVQAALEQGTHQVVILGAGLDTRAYRLAALRDARVYEVDHPDSQREKRERTRDLVVLAGELRYVALDLESGRLQQALAAAGHSGAEPSLWIVEGLVPYLEPPAIPQLLHEIGLASAPGSRLLLTYVTPDLVWLRHARPLLLASMRLLGEPLHSAVSAEQMARWLHEEGFALEDDTDTRDWAHALCPSPSREPLISYERLANAIKR